MGVGEVSSSRDWPLKMKFRAFLSVLEVVCRPNVTVEPGAITPFQDSFEKVMRDPERVPPFALQNPETGTSRSKDSVQDEMGVVPVFVRETEATYPLPQSLVT